MKNGSTIKDENQELIHNISKTEEIRDIIDRMPNNFAKTITLIVTVIVLLLFLFGFIVKYPDIVSGDINISSEQPPLQLVAEQSGRLRINNVTSQDKIQSGQLLAWIDNPAHPKLIDKLTQVLDSLVFPVTFAKSVYSDLPKNLNLGDLTMPYSSFLSAIKQLADYQESHLYDRQGSSLKKILNEQNTALKHLMDKENLSFENLKLNQKFLERDSQLLKKKIISQYEFEQSLANKIVAEDQLKSSLRNSASIREEINNTENSIQQNIITKSEKELQLELEVLTSFNNLVDKINLWKKQYLIYSPIHGKIQFLKFWNENQFVQSGESIFSIVPEENVELGKIYLPIVGAGKVKEGQKVIVKLADFPYMEYGYLVGVVNNISLTTSKINTNDGRVMDSYLITVKFPNGLETNYGNKLGQKNETKGIAEIITRDRKLIDRFFDNLKYISN